MFKMLFTVFLNPDPISLLSPHFTADVPLNANRVVLFQIERCLETQWPRYLAIDKLHVPIMNYVRK